MGFPFNKSAKLNIQLKTTIIGPRTKTTKTTGSSLQTRKCSVGFGLSTNTRQHTHDDTS